MRCELYTTNAVSSLNERVTYSLLCDEAKTSGVLGCEIYGVKVDMGEESAARPHLTVSRSAVGRLLEQMARCGVTPVAVDDVVDDWLGFN
jgi:hypothetical protein